MAFRIFKVGKIWHYRFQIGTNRIQRTTRDRNQDRAHRIAQKAFDDAVIRANGGQPIPTLQQLIDAWAELQGPLASASYRRSIDVFVRRHLYGLGEVRIDRLTTELVEKARVLHLANRKPASANHWLRILRMLCKWAVRRKIIPALPWDVAKLPEQKVPRAILPTAKTDRWFAAVDLATKRRPSVAVAIRLMYGLGVRASEAATSRWEWIDWERGTYTPGITKGKEAVAVPIPRWLIDYLAPRRRKEGAIAPGKRGQLPDGYARRAIQSANRATSLTGITPHRLRGTCATLMSEEGIPVQTIQVIMRHKDPSTTMRYLEVNFEHAKRAQERIADKVGFGGRKNGEHQARKPHGRSRA